MLYSRMFFGKTSRFSRALRLKSVRFPLRVPRAANRSVPAPETQANLALFIKRSKISTYKNSRGNSSRMSICDLEKLNAFRMNIYEKMPGGQGRIIVTLESRLNLDRSIE